VRNEAQGFSQMTGGSESSVLSQLTPGKILFVTVFVTATWVLLKWMRALLDRLEHHNPRLRFMLRQVEPPLRIVIWFLAVFVSADVLAPSKNAFLAALGSAALAIGLGLQDLIKNLIGGLVIVVDRPFQTGDRVRLAEAHGEVKQIGLRSTKVYTDKGELVTIPNADVLTKLTFNANAGVAESVVSTEMALPSEADADQALHICREIAVCCPYTHLGRHIEINLDEDYKRTRILLTIQAYVYDHRFESAMKTDILRRARHEFLVQGIIKGPESIVNQDRPLTDR
jgi:small-conductance mechanosensitive channel